MGPRARAGARPGPVPGPFEVRPGSLFCAFFFLVFLFYFYFYTTQTNKHSFFISHALLTTF